ncbi:TfoX/Sxy family protein [Carboxylicivirga mesophila]|uniref:TfoX/Sxy family protein n=1 Tax=Carboxylicivirga mesophila TaxID=1166478 RepID=A0ABS5K6K7_9BACT|nr:TfoX/Sxy family protein [Carboxylicivirga mesophila]MBS2210577.1 TfoX/Sxy family protein [Carboxylicivirga mesophila]
MAYDEYLADRVRQTLKSKAAKFIEKKMMGGLCFMVDDKMCVGIIKNNLMARISPNLYEQYLTEEGCKQMDFTGRPMKGFVMIEPAGTDMDDDLDKWVQRCLNFNPMAKSRKKK